MSVTAPSRSGSQKLGQPLPESYLVVGGEQRLAARDAAVGAVVLGVPVDAGEGPLGATVPGHLELERVEPLPPALLGGGQVGLGDLLGVGHWCTLRAHR